MSHYLSADAARELDQRAIERIQNLDPEGLYRVVTDLDISMCGFVPTTVTLFAARALGATRATLVRYGHSGERTGDFTRVVGYAGFVLS
jgi:AmmeMemoRadiSam system protein B